MVCARVGVGDSFGVDRGTMSVGFFTTFVGVLIERVLELRESHLYNFLSDLFNGYFNLEGLHYTACLSDFLWHLDCNLVNICGGNLDLERFFLHLCELNIARYFHL